jgi:hypothetical protein
MNKFYLSMSDFEINGYRLISPLKGENPVKINDIIDDGEAKEIIVDNILDYIAVEQLSQYIRMLAGKLQHSGKLIITGNDLTIICEQFIRGEVNVIDFNRLLFGLKNHAWNFKLSSITLGDIVEICKLCGLKILERKLNGPLFVIKAERQ